MANQSSNSSDRTDAEARQIFANLNRNGALSKALHDAIEDFAHGRNNQYDDIEDLFRDMDESLGLVPD